MLARTLLTTSQLASAGGIAAVRCAKGTIAPSLACSQLQMANTIGTTGRCATSDEEPRKIENEGPQPVSRPAQQTLNDWPLDGDQQPQHERSGGPVGSQGVDRDPQVQSSPHDGARAFVQETAGDASRAQPQAKMSTGVHSDMHSEPEYPPQAESGASTSSGGRAGETAQDQAMPFQPAAAPAQPIKASQYIRGEDANLVPPSEVGQAEGQETVKGGLRSTLEDPAGLSSG